MNERKNCNWLWPQTNSAQKEAAAAVVAATSRATGTAGQALTRHSRALRIVSLIVLRRRVDGKQECIVEKFSISFSNFPMLLLMSWNSPREAHNDRGIISSSCSRTRDAATVELIVTMILTIQRLLQNAAGYDSEKKRKKPQKIVVISGYESRDMCKTDSIVCSWENCLKTSVLNYTGRITNSNLKLQSHLLRLLMKLKSLLFVMFTFSVRFSSRYQQQRRRREEVRKKRISNFNPDQTPNRWCEIRSERVRAKNVFFFFFWSIQPRHTVRAIFVLNSNIFPR